MPQDEYDLAGFAVGVVDKKDLITGENIKPGDTLIGIASSGVHSNGFSLVRSVFTMTEESLNTYYDSLGKTLGEALLAPTKIYVKTMKEIKKAGVKVKGCSHITGGGFYENVPRMLPDGVKAVIKKDSYEVPPIFKMLAEDGNIEEHMMYNTLTWVSVLYLPLILLMLIQLWQQLRLQVRLHMLSEALKLARRELLYAKSCSYGFRRRN